MYGGLDIAEAIRLGTLDSLKDSEHQPHIQRRGIKFNIPLDLRTPSYTCCSDAAQANIPEMWERAFWTEFLDAMARHRYNVLSLWSLHPFPSLVKVPEFPEVALNDVWRTCAKLDDTFSFAGNDMVRPAMLADHEVVKRLTINEKIEFWRWVMQHAADRGIQVYFFTWNVFTWGAEGKHGITNDLGNEITKQYFRASVREMVKTYPLLAGMGITAGEGMPQDMDSKAKEAWLWDTYGEGVRDALVDTPQREFRMIHRFHWTAQGDILDAFKDYPGPFEFSFKYSVAHMYSIPNPPFIQPLLENLAPAGRPGSPCAMTTSTHSASVIPLSPASTSGTCPRLTSWPAFIWDRTATFGDATSSSAIPTPARALGNAEAMVFVHALGAACLRSLAAGLPLRADAGRSSSQGFVAASLSCPPGRVAGHAADHAILLGGHRSQVVSRGMLEPSEEQGLLHRAPFHGRNLHAGPEVLCIRDWRVRLTARQPMEQTTPLEIAEALDGAVAETMASLDALREAAKEDSELRKTVTDCEALAWLGRYYASKIRGACALALFDVNGDKFEHEAALRHLGDALAHWKRYAALRDAHYVPALYNRVGHVNVTALTEKVAADLDIARNWKPGSLEDDGSRSGTEKGFRK